MDLSVLRRTAAEIAAAAVFEMYPDVELLGGGETSVGFFYDFYFPHLIHPHLIEERIRQIVREKRPIRTLEMVPFSARELLKKEGHLARADEIEEGGLVEVVQIGSFHDLSEGPHLKNTAELAAFKISAEPLPEKGMRVNGWCHRSKDDLKEFLKKLDRYVEPAKLGEKMGLWKGEIWLPEGLRTKQILIDFLKKQWFAGAYEVSCPPRADRMALHRSLGKEKVGEIWVSEENKTHIQISFFQKSEQEIISFLHSIAKTLTILGFDHSIVPNGSGSDYVVVDDLDRSWPVVQIQKKVVTAEVDQIFSLLLEKNLFLQMVNIENK